MPRSPRLNGPIVVALLALTLSACTTAHADARAPVDTSGAASLHLEQPAEMAHYCKSNLFITRLAATYQAVGAGVTVGSVDARVSSVRSVLVARPADERTLETMMTVAAERSTTEALNSGLTSSQELTRLVDTHDATDVAACAAEFNPSAVPSPTTSVQPQTRAATTPQPAPATATASATAAGVPEGPTCAKSFGTVIDNVRHGDYDRVMALDAAPDDSSKAVLDKALTVMFTSVDQGASMAQAVADAAAVTHAWCATHPNVRAIKVG